MNKENVIQENPSFAETLNSIKLELGQISSRYAPNLKSRKDGLDNGVQPASIRCRPILKGVQQEYVHAYILSFAYRLAVKYEIDELFLKFIKPPKDLSRIKFQNDLYNYHAIQEFSYEYLLNCLSNDQKIYDFVSKENKLNFVEVNAAINKRRRQEDRYFHVKDIRDYNFKNLTLDDEIVPVFGVFDGHMGPEISEHCSHLFPYLIAQEFASNESKANPVKILSNVFYTVSQSVLDGQNIDLWKGGSTATISMIYKGSIYTAWIGDSQAWLIFDSDKEKPLQSNGEDQTLEMNYDEGMPLTDILHRPSEAEEFVSVNRTGGLVILKSTSLKKSLLPACDLRTHSIMHSQMISPTMKNSPPRFSDPAADKLTDKDLIQSTLMVPDVAELDGARVAGQCNVSRSFGDDHVYPGMNSLPSITVCNLNHLKKPLSCLVIATDGLWDDYSGCGPNVAKLVVSLSPEERRGLAQRLVKLTIDSQLSDNVTVLVAHLNQLPASLTTHSNYLVKKAEDDDADKTSLPVNSHPPRKTLWPIMGRNRVSSCMHLNDPSMGVRGPRGFTSIGYHAQKINLPNDTMLPFRKHFSESDLTRIENSIVTLSSPVRVLDTD